jgi:hypothetical protein
MAKHSLEFRYDMALENDEYNSVKEVVIRCNTLDPEDILDAFTEFCACMNVPMQGQITEPEDETNVH